MYFEWLFFMQIIMVILMIVFIQKLNQMKKQIDNITKEVYQYISFVTDDIEEQKIEMSVSPKLVEKKPEEAQNRLIQAGLGEYFP